MLSSIESSRLLFLLLYCKETKPNQLILFPVECLPCYTSCWFTFQILNDDSLSPCAWDESRWSRCSWSYGVIWILRFQFGLAIFLMKIVYVIPGAVEEGGGKKNKMKPTSHHLSVAYGFLLGFQPSDTNVSVLWLQTFVALARMLHFSNSQNASCMLGQWIEQCVSWMTLQCSLQACLLRSFNSTLLWAAVASGKHGFLLMADNCPQQESCSQENADPALSGPPKQEINSVCLTAVLF